MKFSHYEIHYTSDKRKRVGDLPERAYLSVFAHNGFVLDDKGPSFKNGTVLYTTPSDEYEGGQQQCEAFIAGRQSVVSRPRVTTVASASFEMPEPAEIGGGRLLAELSDHLQNEDPK